MGILVKVEQKVAGRDVKSRMQAVFRGHSNEKRIKWKVYLVERVETWESI